MKFIVAIMLPWVILIAQVPDTLWTKTYGGDSLDCGMAIQQTGDGGFIIVGSTRSFGAGESDVYLIRVNADGSVVWARSYGGASSDSGLAVQQTSDGGYIVSGVTSSWGSGGKDIYLIKTDPNGDTVWTKTYGGRLDDEGRWVQQTSDGGYVIFGDKHLNSYRRDMYLLRTDSVGNLVWEQTYYTRYLGDGSYVEETPDGGFYLVGSTEEYWTPYKRDLWIAVVDSLGNLVWKKRYGGSDYEWGNSGRILSDGGYIAVGMTRSYGGGHEDIYIVRTDSLGNLTWERFYGGSGEEQASSVVATAGGDFVISAWTSSFGAGGFDLWVLKVDSLGDTLWARTYGGASDDLGLGIEILAENEYMLVGQTASFGAGESDVWLLRMGIKPEVSGGADVGLKDYNIPTIFSGPLRLPSGRRCRVFDVSGRRIEPDQIRPGVYFIEIDGRVGWKVVKIR
ncbi:hypothetical protein DRP53_07855 [candidate division WOR-3 bacterium]|uniref:T9SS type A sorting domain-containing protein n=1 Tax=candidate division WOR-3 bacterium TaxID=2052148 RepID=A0A660SHR5_UNCW3|nr:MAG: hypothetical protein DRP53_07855 [candidate division WOR-3 bacterium]